MEKLGDILRYTKPHHVLSAAMVCQRAQEILGGRGQVVAIKNGVLKIRAADNYVASSIAQNNIELIERINERLGEPIVKKLRFEIATPP